MGFKPFAEATHFLFKQSAISNGVFFALLQDTTVRAHAELLDIQILVNPNHADL